MRTLAVVAVNARGHAVLFDVFPDAFQLVLGAVLQVEERLQADFTALIAIQSDTRSLLPFSRLSYIHSTWDLIWQAEERLLLAFIPLSSPFRGRHLCVGRHFPFPCFRFLMILRHHFPSIKIGVGNGWVVGSIILTSRYGTKLPVTKAVSGQTRQTNPAGTNSEILNLCLNSRCELLP